MLPVVDPAAPCIYCLRDIKDYELVKLNELWATELMDGFM